MRQEETAPAAVEQVTAAVLALADEWERTGERLQGVPAAQTWLLVSAQLRAALADSSALDRHHCPYPASGCTDPRCNISQARAEQRAYERGHVDGFNKALGMYDRADMGGDS